MFCLSHKLTWSWYLFICRWCLSLWNSQRPSRIWTWYNLYFDNPLSLFTFQMNPMIWHILWFVLKKKKKKRWEEWVLCREKMTCNSWEYFVGQQYVNNVQEVGFHAVIWLFLKGWMKNQKKALFTWMYRGDQLQVQSSTIDFAQNTNVKP